MSDELLEEKEDEILEELEDEDPSPGLVSKLKSKLPNLRGRFSLSRKWMLMGLAGVMVVILGISVWFFFLAPAPEPEPEEVVETAEEAVPVVPTIEEVYPDIVVLEPFKRMYLADGSAMAYLNVNVALELMAPEDREQVTARQEQIREVLAARFREMKWIDLRSPSGKIRMKYEALARINSAFPKPLVRNIYFTNFIMQ